MKQRINFSRLKNNLTALSKFGQNESGGITRPSFCSEDLNAKKWLVSKMRTAKLKARIDAVGNVFGRLGPDGPAVMAGSHLDTVREGGMFDGALGVLAALECLQTIEESKLPHRLPLEMIAFSDEEASFSNFLGSRGFACMLAKGEINSARNSQGIKLTDAMIESGLNPMELDWGQKTPPEVKAYLELHIEQGNRLDHENVPIGIVQSIVGIASYEICFLGEANHAGTTPFKFRKDAFLGAADFSVASNKLIRSQKSGVMTIGQVGLKPGVSNIIPGEARLYLEIRNASTEKLIEMEHALKALAQKIAKDHKLEMDFCKTSVDKPVILSKGITKVIENEALALGYDFKMMDSGAGHDAQIMAQITKTGMIFIPSIDGKSHCPEENSRWEDIEKGAQLLLNSLIKLSNSL